MDYGLKFTKKIHKLDKSDRVRLPFYLLFINYVKKYVKNQKESIFLSLSLIYSLNIKLFL